MPALREVALTVAQIEALLKAADIAEALWWNDPLFQRRLAALGRARRKLIDAHAADRPAH